MKTREERLRIAEKIIRDIDTVTLVTCQEAENIRARALAGEFDTIYEVKND